jgi:hypothetical protein
MLEKQQQLYQRICDYELDDPSHEFGLLAHLMRANGWSRPFALRAIEEYRKFVFLALVADHPVTPSDQVDQVWHLHLLCSDAYWNDFCPRVLGRPLHHHRRLVRISRKSCRAIRIRHPQGLGWQRLIPVLEALLTSARHTEFPCSDAG